MINARTDRLRLRQNPNWNPEKIDTNKMRHKALAVIVTPDEPSCSRSYLFRSTMLQKRSTVETEIESTSVLTDSSGDESNLNVSPPKQQKFSTDGGSGALTPSRLLARLSVDDDDDNEDTKKNKNKTEKHQKEFQINKFQNARRLLNSEETTSLPGREKEYSELDEFLSDHLENRKSGSLYVSGQPGTGKTACLSKLLKSENYSLKFTKVYINCTSISTVGSIYKKITTELALKLTGKTDRDYLAAITKYFKGKHKMVLMVLDEIDQLCSTKQSVLYTIFEWPLKFESKIILIGIANSLDLTDRLLIRLNTNCKLKPKLMHFPPYSKQQIIEIFKTRLEEGGVLDLFPAVTIQLLAAKVAAVSGDVRRALDIGRRVIQLAETEGKNKKLNLNDLGIERLCEDGEEEKDDPVQVQIKQVVNVLNDVYGASQTLNDDMDDDFPLQQKILICSLMLILKNSKNKDITVGRLHDIYKRVCNKRNILAVDQTDFVGLCSLVDTRGIIRIIKKKEPRLYKIVLQWDELEVSRILKDKQLISQILSDSSCLVGK